MCSVFPSRSKMFRLVAASSKWDQCLIPAPHFGHFNLIIILFLSRRKSAPWLSIPFPVHVLCRLVGGAGPTRRFARSRSPERYGSHPVPPRQSRGIGHPCYVRRARQCRQVSPRSRRTRRRSNSLVDRRGPEFAFGSVSTRRA